MESILEKGAVVPDRKRIVFLGDSITHNGTYIAHMNMYFFQHVADKKLDFINLGVSSETASGLSEPDHPFPRPCVHERIDRALAVSKPEWAVVCYGMNDGIYHPLSEQRFKAYKEGITGVINKIHAVGAKAIVLTPPPFDPASAKNCRLLQESGGIFSFREPFVGYDTVLKKYGEWILSELDGIADKVIDIHTPLKQYINKQREHDPDYISGDGIHPNIDGHWIIASTFLKELFTICLDQIPAHVMSPESSTLFKLVMERHRTLSAAWKEHIGHTNPNKDEALPLEEALLRAKGMEEEIHAIIGKDKGESAEKVSLWKGYERHDFYIGGREAILIEPKTPAHGNPWVWRTEFFDAFSYADMALLEKGWHIAYLRISNMYGCPEAVDRMRSFQEYMVKTYKLASRAVLFGFSRGGLYAFNYAARYPQDVAALYLDAPVLDIRSWPGGKGAGSGAPKEWRQCLAIYGLDEETVKSFKENPLDKAEAVVKAEIPVIIVAGDADEIVPMAENTVKLVECFKKQGGKIKLIVKPGVGHHPHSLEEPGEIVEFLQENAMHRL